MYICVTFTVSLQITRSSMYISLQMNWTNYSQKYTESHDVKDHSNPHISVRSPIHAVFHELYHNVNID
jgi:hypothetical protein